ncbi:transcription factor BIM1-like [Impatiens glandulifera]|uniref:transcription factor BIM1-like n=1 Tax=Impatiens glandulifera TaxID=253017 RepID=UPI001FB086DF|nr:transcription factor BIM1-like [Impatiens glandulifera]
MELPQPRPLGSEGRKQTHDFLSLYAPVQQDPRTPPPPQGNFLQTHDFLQPLSSMGLSNGKEGTTLTTTERIWEKPPIIPGPSPPPTGEHFLPGGIGTYSISHISLCNKVPKVEGSVFTMAQTSSINKNDVNSNCSSYPGNGFTLWERSAMKKGKTGKENIAGEIPVTPEAGIILGEGEWMTSERPSQSSSNNSSNHHLTSTTYSSLSSSQPLSAKKNQSFMDMLKSAQVAHEEDDEDETEFLIKEEPLSHPRSDLMIVDHGKRDDQKPNTPRSKHSATEQRRRSKINDRFQRLRELIPRSDQKRDKASFLLEVIEYIQFLQDKVQKYEGPYQGYEPSKLGPWASSHRPPADEVEVANSSTSQLMSVCKNDAYNEPKSSSINNNPLNSGLLLHPDENESMVMSTMKTRMGVNASNSSPPLAQLWTMKESLTDSHQKHKGQEQQQQQNTVESGTINISTAYSRGLLNNLTQALQSSGVDLTHATISVKVDIGKQPNGILTIPPIPNSKENVNRRARVEGNEATKRLKTSNT